MSAAMSLPHYRWAPHRAGEVKVSATSVLDMHPDSAQSRSGIGGHGDDALLRFFTGQRIVGVDLSDAPI